MKANNSVAEICDFLIQVSAHNDREWFNKNKDLYLRAQALFNELSQSLIDKVSMFDPSVSNLTVKDCTYRIYRDIRFSLDKSPYKTHMGVFIAPGGKKSWHSGYYLHLEPQRESMLVVGAYMPDKPALDSIREDIFSRSEEFLEALNLIKGFQLDTTNKLKKVPYGFPSDSPMTEYLKQKDFCLEASIPEKFLNGDIDSLVDFAVKMFKPARQLNDFLNRAIDAAHEE